MRLRLGIVFLSGQHACQIFEIQGQINMVRAECLFTNVQGPFKEGQGFLIVFLRVVQGREVTQADGELRIAVSKNLFVQTDSATQQWFGLLIFALRIMEPGQFRQRSGKPGILFPEGFRFLERGGVLFLGLFEASLLKEKITLVHVSVPRGFRVLASREADHPNQACCHQHFPITIQHIVTFFRICKKRENEIVMTLGSSEDTFSDCKESNSPVPTEKCE